MSLPIAITTLLLFLSFSLSTAFIPIPPPTASCPDVLDPRIVGGTKSRSLTPYMAAVFNPEGTFVCSGVLLSPRWILTAAHCFVTQEFTIRVGGLRANEGQAVLIKRVISHPDFNAFTNMHDISVIELKKAVPKGSQFMLINREMEVKAGVYTRVAGYGAKREGLKVTPKSVLRSVDVPVVSRTFCRSMYNTVDRPITKNMICAGKEGCDSCQGDSGGPMMMFGKNGIVLAGIVSFGKGCARSMYPGVYTNIGLYRAWLRRTGVVFGIGKGVKVRV